MSTPKPITEVRQWGIHVGPVFIIWALLRYQLLEEEEQSNVIGCPNMGEGGAPQRQDVKAFSIGKNTCFHESLLNIQQINFF